MKLNKKAIMISFLTTLILALIIFIPACMGVSKILRLSDQSKDSFNSFVSELNTFAENTKVGGKGSAFIILDQATSVYSFPADSKIIKRTIVNAPFASDYISKVYINRPSQCPENKSCVCLCRDISPHWKEEGTLQMTYEIEITCKKYYCKDMVKSVKPDNALASNLGEVEYSESFAASSDYPTASGMALGWFENEPDNYRITGGFAIERHTDTVPFGIRWGDFNQRRQFFQLELLSDNTIKLTPQT